MQAIRIHKFGGPEALRYEQAPTPKPGPDQVLVQLAAAGLNYIDVYQRTGCTPSIYPTRWDWKDRAQSPRLVPK